MMKSYHVNYLLSISRLPDHFYPMVNNLTPEQAKYQNPGSSLRSYIVANCLRQDIAPIPDDLTEIINECVMFSTSAEIISKIVDVLIKTSKDQLIVISELDPVNLKKLSKHTQLLSDLASQVKIAFDTFIMTQDPAKDQADILSSQGIMLKSTMIDLHSMSERVSEILLTIPPPKELA